MSYKNGGVAIHANIANASKYTYTVHHAVNNNLQVAAALSCESGKETGLIVGGKYSLDGSAYLKAKLDHNLNLGVSYSQAFGSNVQATLSACVNGKALDQGGHQVGLHLNFDA